MIAVPAAASGPGDGRPPGHPKPPTNPPPNPPPRTTGAAVAAGPLVGDLVAWQHPTNPSRTYHGRVVRVGARFIEVKDSIATEGVLPEWIIRTRSTVSRPSRVGAW